MRSVRVWATLSGGAVLLSASLSHAQCTKDVECKGDRICQDGNCVEPPAEASTTPPSGVPAAAATAPVNAATALPPPAAPPPATTSQAPYANTSPVPAPEPRYVRRSGGMFAGGIVLVSIGALALGVAMVSSGTSRCDYDSVLGRQRCDRSPDYTAFLISAGLLGGGIPMVVIGGKRVPAQSQAGLLPWVSPEGGGLRLELSL